MKWASRWGDPWGDVKNLRCLQRPTSLGGGVRLSWDHSVTPDAWYKVFLNKVEIAVTKDNFVEIFPPQGEQSFYEVLPVGPGNRFADYTHLMEPLDGNKALISWDGSTSGDTDYYHVYTDNKTGTVDYNTVIATVNHLGSGAVHTWKSDALTDGTWKFGVRAVDDATNEETNVTTVSVTIGSYPLAVTGLSYSWNDLTKKVTLTWTASASSDIASYKIYGNGGSGFIDYSTALATVAHPTVTWESPAIASPGVYNYGVRAVDTSAREEFNTDVVVSITLVGTPPSEQAALPNAPTGLSALAVAGGKIQLTWEYDGHLESATPTLFSVYYDNGTGTVDYVTPLTTVAYSAGTPDGKVLEYTFLTGALVDATTYKFGVRASAGADEEENTVTVSEAADSAAPNPPTSLAGAVTY